MTEQSPAEAIFFAALEKGSAEERAAYLAAACGADRNLRQRVERLLAAHPQVGSFLEPAAEGKAEPVDAPTVPPREQASAGPRQSETSCYHGPAEEVGTVLAGRYKLLEALGEGGMGAVFMAQQTEPVKRLVAVKLIQQGMDSRQVLARFEAERQALALMDHPNIAKVLDAGVTESGRPFFVMELVKGVPITRFCDERQLSPRERLELFIPVCQAIQHAHQKGVIHRDIKPTNVLVALYDDHPVPKVIDFGVAKAAGTPLTDASLVTGFGAIVGTPEYMSPEQAQLNQLDVDTRSDVYALGVLLYELLTGTTPIDRKRLGQDALFEILRVIREDEPLPPSTRLSTSEARASIAATRRTEPAKLARLLRGELDWIVMKCLEKERARRYETANGLARDLQHYLQDEVVEARPPSAGYRLRKLARKHRTALTTAATVVLLLAAGAAVSTWLAVRATRAESTTARALAVAEQNHEEADRQRQQADEQRQKAETQAASLALDIDLKYCEDGDIAVGLLRLADTLRTIPEHATALRECAALNILSWGQRFLPAMGPLNHDGYAVTGALLSPDGRTLLTSGKDGSVRLWDVLTGKPLKTLGQPPRGRRQGATHAELIQFSKDGSTAVTVHSGQPMTIYGNRGLEAPGGDTVVKLWDLPTGRLRFATPKHPGTLWQVTLSQSGSLLATTCIPSPSQSTVAFWNAANGRLILKLGFQGSRPSLDLSPDGKSVLIAQDDQFSVWSTGEVIPSKRLPGFNTTFSPGGASAVSVLGGTVRWWNTADWQLQRTIDLSKEPMGPFGYVYAGFISEDLLAVTNATNWCKVYVRNVSTPIEYAGFIMNNLPADTIRASLNGRLVLIGAHVYDAQSGQRFPPSRGHRFRPELREFVKGGWYPSFHDSFLVDLAADKKITLGRPPTSLYFGNVHEGRLLKNPVACVLLDYDRLVVLRKADASLDAELLRKWCQVITRGKLDENGRFSKFGEATWEKARLDLAQLLDADPNAQSLRAAVTDNLYWLRQEIKYSPAPLPLLDRLIALEPTWPNYRERAAAHAKLEHWDLAMRDELEAAQLTGERYWREGSPFSDWMLGARMVQTPGRPREQYELALRWGEARIRAGIDLGGQRGGVVLTGKPNQPFVRRTFSPALVQFRLNRYAEALALIRKGDVPKLAQATGMLMSPWNVWTNFDQPNEAFDLTLHPLFAVDPIELCVRAMCHHHLEQPKEAQACLRQVHELEAASGPEGEAFVREAEALIEGKPRP